MRRDPDSGQYVNEPARHVPSEAPTVEHIGANPAGQFVRPALPADRQAPGIAAGPVTAASTVLPAIERLDCAAEGANALSAAFRRARLDVGRQRPSSEGVTRRAPGE